MRFIKQFLSLAIFVIAVCASEIPLEAACEFQIPSSIDNLDSKLFKRNESFDRLQQSLDSYLSKSGETVTKTESFLDEKEASSFYLDSKLPAKNAVESEKLFKNITAFKEEIFENAALTKEERLSILKELIQALVSLGKFKEALGLCKDFSDRYSESKLDIIGLYYSIGVSFQNLNRYDEAIQSYKEALLCNSAKSGLINSIRINLGWCYYKKGKFTEAIDEYNHVLSEGPLAPGTIQWAWFEVGRCNFFLKNYEEAISAFKEVVLLNPDTKIAQEAKTNIIDIEKINKEKTS